MNYDVITPQVMQSIEETLTLTGTRIYGGHILVIDGTIRKWKI